MPQKGKHRRVRSHTGETLEDIVLEERLFVGSGVQNMMDSASGTWGTIRGLFDKKKSKGPGWEVYNAASTGDDKLLAKLLDRPSAPQDVNFVKPTSENTPLHKAAQYGNSVCAFLLVYADCNINTRNKDGETPLHLAMKANHLDMVTFLMQHGANPNIIDNILGFSPVHFAARNGSSRCFSAMVGVISEYNQRKESKHEKKVSIIEIDINLRTKAGQTALHLCSIDRGAFRKNNSQIALQLCTLGADVNAVDSMGRTPLHIASYYGAFENASILVEHGASKTQQDFKGKIPLDLCMTELSLHVNLGSVERKLLGSKLATLLRPSPHMMRQSSDSLRIRSMMIPSDGCARFLSSSAGEEITYVSPSGTGDSKEFTGPSSTIKNRKRGHSRNKSLPALTRQEIQVEDENDKEKRKAFMKEATLSLSNELVVKILLHHEAASKKHVFLSFHRTWSVQEAKEYVCRYLKMDDTESFSLFIPGPRMTHQEMKNEDLLSSYKLADKAEIIFQEQDARFKPNSPNARAKKKRKKLQRNDFRNKRESTLDLLGKFWPGTPERSTEFSPTESPQRDSSLSKEPIAEPNIGVTVETPPFHVSTDSRALHKSGDFSDLEDIKPSSVQLMIDDAVAKATVVLENEICRLKLRLPVVNNQRHAEITLPKNKDGCRPSDANIWCPQTLWELQTMRNRGEDLRLDKEGKKIQKLDVSMRLEKLLAHYHIHLPPAYPFFDALRVLNDYVIYGDEVVDEVYASLTTLIN